MEAKRIHMKYQVLCDEEKQRQTNHWDMDFLSREQLDALYAVSDNPPAPPPPEQRSTRDDLSNGDGSA